MSATTRLEFGRSERSLPILPLRDVVVVQAEHAPDRDEVVLLGREDGAVGERGELADDLRERPPFVPRLAFLDEQRVLGDAARMNGTEWLRVSARTARRFSSENGCPPAMFRQASWRTKATSPGAAAESTASRRSRSMLPLNG